MLSRSFFPWKGLSSQFFLFIILPSTILLLVIAYGGLRLHQLSMRELVGERDVRAVRVAAHTLEEAINSHLILLKSTADLIDPKANLTTYTGDNSLFSSYDQGVSLISSKGEFIALQPDHQLSDSIQSSLRQHISATQPLPNSPQYVLINQDQSDHSVLVIWLPLKETGWSIAGAISLETFIEDTIKNLYTPETGGLVYIVGEDKNLIYHIGIPIQAHDLINHPGVEQALGGGNGSTYIQGPSREHVVAYSAIQPMSWALVVEEPWENVTSPLLRITEYAPLLLIPIILLAIMILWFVSTQIVQPLLHLEKKAGQLAWGDFEAIEESVGGVEEIRALQDTLIYIAHKIRDAQKGLRGYIGAITRGQEEERTRLARELHDDTLQSLIALKQRIHIASMQPGIHSESLAEIQAMTATTIEDLRRFTRALRPIYLEDLGLVPALEMQVQEYAQSSGIQILFHQEGIVRRLPPEVELALYRINQEALSNATRHSFASEIIVKLSLTLEEITLTIHDNGKGFLVPDSTAEFTREGHYGLLGIQERAELIGARLIIQSQPTQGTTINIIVRVKEQD